MSVLRALSRRADINITDVLLISLMGWWSLWMLLPFSTIADSQTYQPMWDIAPRVVWGYGGILVVLVKVWAILECNWRARGLVLTIMVMWWSFIATMAFFASPRGPGWGLIGIVALTGLWRVVQIAATGDRLIDSCQLETSRDEE